MDHQCKQTAVSELFGQASIDHNKEKTALQSFPLFATFFMFFYAWPLWLTNGPPLISTRPPKASDIIHILIPRWFHVMSYLFLQPGSGSNNMVLDSKALKCRKKYTCLWKLCKWIVYYVCPCKYYKQKECKMHTICLKSAKILAWHISVSYRKVGQGRNKQRRLLFLLALPCRQGTKKRRYLIFPRAGQTGTLE